MQFTLYKILLILLIVFLCYKYYLRAVIITIRQLFYLKKNGKAVKGRVVESTSSKESEGIKIYFTKIEYKVENNLYQIKDLTPKFKPDLIDNGIEVIYDPKDPSNALLNNFSLVIIGFVSLLIWGILMIVLTLIIFNNDQGSTNNDQPIYP